MPRYNKHIFGQQLTSPKFKGSIKSDTTNDLFGVLVLQQEMFDQIFTESGQLAQGNEFQFHYTALIGTHQNQGQEIRVSIPLVCYNYKQTVSGAHIGFNLEEVETMSDETLSIAQMKAAEFMKTDTCTQLTDLFDITDWEIAPVQAMHRHPGGSHQGFSGTDYQTDPNNSGIVFPLCESPEKSINFSSIMYVNADVCTLAHTEVRSAIGTVETEDGILYSKGKSLTVVSGYNHVQTDIEKMFGIEGKSFSSFVYSDYDKQPAELSSKLLEIADKSTFMPEIFIDSDNLSTRTAGYYTPKSIKPIQAHNQQQKRFDMFEKDDVEQISDGLYTEQYPAYMETDPLEQDKDGVYIADVYKLDDFDKEILCESLREDLCDIKLSSGEYVFTELKIALKPEHEIFRLARLHKILKG